MQARAKAILFLFLLVSCFSVCAAQVRVQAHLDKDRYLAGAPVFVVWEYTNTGGSPVPFEEKIDLYCWPPYLVAPAIAPAVRPICPDAYATIFNCESIKRTLKPGEKYIAKYLLNDLFDLHTPGTYEVTVYSPDIGDPTSAKTTLKLVLDPAGEAELIDVYRPFIVAVNSPNPAERMKAGQALHDSGLSGDVVRVLADSGLRSTENALLQLSSDPLGGIYVQSIANAGLGRLRTPAACARLAELAVHPELAYQQTAIEELGRCADPRYIGVLFQMASNGDVVPATREFALAAAGEAGGETAVDRLLILASPGSQNRAAALHGLGRTGSERAAGAVVGMLPSLIGDARWAALSSLTTLTHRESVQKSFDAQAMEWQEWWASPQKKEVYQPRDCRGGIRPLHCTIVGCAD